MATYCAWGEDILVRKVLPNCVKPDKVLLYSDIPNLNVQKPIETARDREKWKKLILACNGCVVLRHRVEPK